MATTRLYRDGELVEKDFPVERISELLGVDGCTVWADFTAPTAADLATIAEELGLHALAVEDAVHEHQRPKLDTYDSHKFLAAYVAHFDPATLQISRSEVKAFILKGAFVTVHDASFDMTRVIERWDSVSHLGKHGASYLLWGLLDVVVDSQFDAVQSIDAETDELEDALFDDIPHADLEKRSFRLRKSLVILRRSVVPMRDVLSTIMRHELGRDDPGMVPYYQDVYDHVLRTTDWTDTVRDLLTTILDTNVGLRGNRMNLIMKKVTSWAAIIAVPTAITGFFGQNLLFPGYGTVWGTTLSTALIVVVGVVLYVSFKRRDWL